MLTATGFVTDSQEFADGTDPNDPNSFKSLPLTVSKLSGSVKFNVDGQDSCSVSGVIKDLPAGFDPADVAVVLDIGGAKAPFTLSAKGRAVSGDGNFSLRLKRTLNKATRVKEFRGGDVQFRAKIQHGTWRDVWKDEGVDPTIAKTREPMTLRVTLRVAATLYSTLVNTAYSSKVGKGGTFKKK